MDLCRGWTQAGWMSIIEFLTLRFWNAWGLFTIGWNPLRRSYMQSQRHPQLKNIYCRRQCHASLRTTLSTNTKWGKQFTWSTSASYTMGRKFLLCKSYFSWLYSRCSTQLVKHSRERRWHLFLSYIDAVTWIVIACRNRVVYRKVE